MEIGNVCRVAMVSALLSGSINGFCQDASTTEKTCAPGAAATNVVNAEWLPSLAPNSGYTKADVVPAALPYQAVRGADVLWTKTVWREVDMMEKQNMPFRYEGDESTGGGMFVEILLDAVRRGKIDAYSAFGGDDRFTTKTTIEQITEQITPSAQEFDVDGPDGEIIHRVIRREFDPHSVTKLRIKEEWVFDRNQGKMIAKIVGIAPVLDVYNEADHTYKGSFAICWLSYPQVREVLAGYEVYNAANNANRNTWEDFFERRMFASRITKVSNPLNQKLDEVFGTDERGKMESLYEGQHIANGIFNHEHDKWEY